jgi:hypothetical protein
MRPEKRPFFSKNAKNKNQRTPIKIRKNWVKNLANVQRQQRGVGGVREYAANNRLSTTINQICAIKLESFDSQQCFFPICKREKKREGRGE